MSRAITTASQQQQPQSHASSPQPHNNNNHSLMRHHLSLMDNRWLLQSRWSDFKGDFARKIGDDDANVRTERQGGSAIINDDINHKLNGLDIDVLTR